MIHMKNIIPTHVYVVATGGFRIAIESDVPLMTSDVSTMAIERFIKMGSPPLGVIMEITECSKDSDPSDPIYVLTVAELEKNGRLIKHNYQN